MERPTYTELMTKVIPFPLRPQDAALWAALERRIRNGERRPVTLARVSIQEAAR